MGENLLNVDPIEKGGKKCKSVQVNSVYLKVYGCMGLLSRGATLPFSLLLPFPVGVNCYTERTNSLLQD